MNKSQLDQARDRHSVVTTHDIGKEVEVVGVGQGILRYIGNVGNKEGLFCGIELFEPLGKHNGTYQGVQYFKCGERHGIFAPLYKVHLYAPKSPTITKVQGSRLSRSALPALQLTSVFSPAASQLEEELHEVQDPMSMNSSLSSLMNNSFVIESASWLEGSMCDSHATFTLPRSKLLMDEEEEFDLLNMKLPKGSTLLKHLNGEPTGLQTLCSSMTLPESRVGVEHLPVIEDENEVDATPLAEMPPSYFRHSMASGYHQDVHGTLNYDNHMDNNSDDEYERNETAYTTQDEMETSGEEIRPSSSVTGEDGFTPDLNMQHSEPLRDGMNGVNAQKNGQPSKGLQEKGAKDSTQPTVTKSKPVPKMTAAALKRLEAAKNIEKEPRREKEKKPSIRELQAAPAQPKFPVKPKAPSKHQLMMEQIKASIEAEKNKPRRERKDRQSLLPPPAPPQPKQECQEKEDENIPGMTVTPTTKIAPTRKKDPLKSVNQSSTAPPPTREPRKPRQSLLPPPTPQKVKKEEIKTTSTQSSISKRSGSTVSNASSTASKQAKPFPTSSFAKSVGGPRTNGTTTSSNVAKKASAPKNSTHLHRLKRTLDAFDVLCLVNACTSKQFEQLMARLTHVTKEKAKKEAHSEQLLQKLGTLDAEYRGKVEEMQKNMEQLRQAHDANVAVVTRNYEKQLEEKTDEYEKALDEEKLRHETELSNVTRRHQSVCAQLDEKLTEAEQLAEKLKEDKLALQNTLAKDNDSKVQMLTAEISSLQTALALKSREMKELRQQNQSLTMQIEEIPSLNLDITKLKHKVGELKQMLDQKRNVEKALVNQNEGLKKTAQQISNMNQSIIQDMDVLRYQMEEKNENGAESSSYSSPVHKVVFRPSRSPIPASARLSTQSHSDLEDSLHRSTVSMYTNNRLSGVCGTDEDVIYAPDEILSSSLGSARLSLSASYSTSRERQTCAQSDSGIGL